jgi:DNA-binding response OmpR family regulator
MARAKRGGRYADEAAGEGRGDIAATIPARTFDQPLDRGRQEFGQGERGPIGHAGSVCYPPLEPVARLVLLSDRSPDQVLPALAATGLDVKVEPLSPDSLAHLPHLQPWALIVDAVENPPHAYAILRTLTSAGGRLPVVAVVRPSDLERVPWGEVVDDFIDPAAPATELEVRLAILRRRAGAGSDDLIRLGRLQLSTETYQVSVDGRPLDLTYKEFELLRFLASRAGRVFTRAALLREVWGYDFYGGTRTVDVHIRRLRAKLGPEHEHLIETVRGVGYRAADVGADR